MKKSLLLFLLLSSNLHAAATTLARLDYIDPQMVYEKNKDITFWSHHEYSVTNNTTNVQSISVCFDIVVCPENTLFLRNLRDCRSFALMPQETVSDQKNEHLTVNYPFYGSCHVLAQTETTGGTPSKATDIQVFQQAFR